MSQLLMWLICTVLLLYATFTNQFTLFEMLVCLLLDAIFLVLYDLFRIVKKNAII